VTALTFLGSESVWIQFKRGSQVVWAARVDATGNTFAPTFPFPLAADTVEIENLSTDPASVWYTVTGF
jgi:hypothetical protein